MSVPYWIEAGEQARVLVVDDAIRVVVYWECLTLDEPSSLACGYYWFSAKNPTDHVFLQEAADMTQPGWETACELASREYFDPTASGDLH